MKRILILLLLVFMLAIPQALAQQKSLGTGRVIFLCGQSSQQIMDQMMPTLPNISRDNYGFIYLNYNIKGVLFIFQFYNDRLNGILIGN
jgi:hypothetical protein